MPEVQLAAAAVVRKRTNENRASWRRGAVLLVGSARGRRITSASPICILSSKKREHYSAVREPIFTSHPVLVVESDALLRKTPPGFLEGVVSPRYGISR
jgi:hypothetical protein